MAKSPAQSITVDQWRNPKWDPMKPSGPDNPDWTYCVSKTVNTIEVFIGQYLEPARLQELIDKGINVSVTNK